MRIIAGHLKDRQINELHGVRTHPMSEKIRGALFNALGDIEGLSILDAYAGTGAIGFEALSRGAQHVVMIEVDTKAYLSIRKTMHALELGNRVASYLQSVTAWSSLHSTEMFDVVILDPPHDDIKQQELKVIAGHTRLNGVLVISLPNDMPKLALTNFETVQQKTYGNAQLVFYRRVS